MYYTLVWWFKFECKLAYVSRIRLRYPSVSLFFSAAMYVNNNVLCDLAVITN